MMGFIQKGAYYRQGKTHLNRQFKSCFHVLTHFLNKHTGTSKLIVATLQTHYFYPAQEQLHYKPISSKTIEDIVKLMALCEVSSECIQRQQTHHQVRVQNPNSL